MQKKGQFNSEMVVINRNNLTIAEFSNVEEVAITLQKTLEMAIELHCGITPKQLSDVVINNCIKEIVTKFNYLTSAEILAAFELSKGIKDSNNWRALTKWEIIKPIESFASQKAQILVEFEKFAAIQEEREQIENKIQSFRKDSLEKYRESLEKGVWIGSMFEANEIAKDLIAPEIEDKIKNQIFSETKTELKELVKAQNNEDLDLLLMPMGVSLYSNTKSCLKRLYSQNLVKHAILKGIII